MLRGLETLSREGLLVLHMGGKLVPLRLVTEHTLVLLLSPEHDIKLAFQPQGQEQGEINGEGTGNCSSGSGSGSGSSSVAAYGIGCRSSAPLIVSDRIRRAVLEPAEVPAALPDALR